MVQDFFHQQCHLNILGTVVASVRDYKPLNTHYSKIFSIYSPDITHDPLATGSEFIPFLRGEKVYSFQKGFEYFPQMIFL